MSGTSNGGVSAVPEPPTDPRVSERFRRQPRAGTRPEIMLRRTLHALGLRYRVQLSIEGLPRRRADLVFPRRRVAVFVDGCFWHGCPEHFVEPRSNRDWWVEKIAANQTRDRGTNAHLVAMGWTVVRLWEHMPISDMVEAVLAALDQEISPTGTARVKQDEASLVSPDRRRGRFLVVQRK